jgi:hypothetical protein
MWLECTITPLTLTSWARLTSLVQWNLVSGQLSTLGFTIHHHQQHVTSLPFGHDLGLIWSTTVHIWVCFWHFFFVVTLLVCGGTKSIDGCVANLPPLSLEASWCTLMGFDGGSWGLKCASMVLLLGQSQWKRSRGSFKEWHIILLL